MRTVLSTRGQVVLPKAVREQLGWQPGASLEARVTPEGGVLLHLVQGTQASRLRGILAGSPHDVLQDLLAERRAEVERDNATWQGRRLAEGKAHYATEYEPDIEELKRAFWADWPDPPGYDIDDEGHFYRVT